MTRKYTVDISSYDTFRKATFGKLYDVDDAFGHQCWDAAALLWIQLTPPRRLSSGGTGSARGCWEVLSARNTNAGAEFELITDVTKIKRGDIIVFGRGLGQHGHIGFADEDYKTPSISTYSQNQGGTNGVGQAAAFSVRAYRSDALIGAFRFKTWQTQRQVRYRIVAFDLATGRERAEKALESVQRAGFNGAFIEEYITPAITQSI